MPDKEFIKSLQRRTAQISVGASAIRNQGASGLIDCCRYYFENSIDLKEFRKNLKSKKYIGYLDSCTFELVDSFPENGKSWGAARKGLNLFFREVIYNKYLSDYLNMPIDFKENLKMIEYLEVPLDRYVAHGLISKSSQLPKWTSIKDLTPEISEKYQYFAMEYAISKGLVRVHLDLEFWRKNK